MLWCMQNWKKVGRGWRGARGAEGSSGSAGKRGLGFRAKIPNAGRSLKLGFAAVAAGVGAPPWPPQWTSRRPRMSGPTTSSTSATSSSCTPAIPCAWPLCPP